MRRHDLTNKIHRVSPWCIRHLLVVILVGCIWAMAACTLGNQSSGQLAVYFQSPEGFAEWKITEVQLAATAEVAAKDYRSAQTMDTLKAYEKAVDAYLDHGFLLYKAFYNSSIDFPKGLRRSLEERALELMDIADEYLKLGGSNILAVAIAREVIHKYSVDRMDRAQHRAEGILLQYRYQRN